MRLHSRHRGFCAQHETHRTDQRRRNVGAQFEADATARIPLAASEVTLDSGLVDYYMLLQVPQTAQHGDIKSAYRQLQKLCHPDIAGASQGHDMSALLNQVRAAYTVLANEQTRELYDIDLQESRMEAELNFSNKPLSEWLPATQPSLARNWDPAEARGLFVDERTCIGCVSCVHMAPNSFIIEEDYGRARVTKQWADPEHELENAVDCCPVNCIHWVGKEELPVLEHVMHDVDRIDVGTMSAYNYNTLSVFSLAVRFYAYYRIFGKLETSCCSDTFKAKKAEGRIARKSWTEAYMYTKAQQDAMRRSDVAHKASTFSLFAAFASVITWLRNGFSQHEADEEAPASTVSAHKEPVAHLPDTDRT